MSKVVIIVEGGVIQNIIVDNKNTEVLVLDCDVEGLDDDEIKTFHDYSNVPFKARIGFDNPFVCKKDVDMFFNQAERN